MQHLQTLLANRDIEFDARDRQIRCFPHTINICVKHAIDSFLDSAPEEIEQAWINGFSTRADRERYAAAVKKNPIKMGRAIVVAIRASGLRRDDFVDAIKFGNAKNWFKPPGSPIVTLPEHELKRDADTRWDSTHDMMERLIELRCVSRTSRFIANFADLRVGCRLLRFFTQPSRP